MEYRINYLKAWILFSILAVVIAVVGGAVIGAAIGFILGIARVDIEIIRAVGATLGFICGLCSSFYFYKWSIEKYILPQSSFTISAQR